MPDFKTIVDWVSIVSFVVSLISLYLMGTIRSNVISFRKKARLRQLANEIKTIPDDATPLSKATKSKLNSMKRNLPSGYLTFWTSKSKAVRDLQEAIKSEDMPSIKDGIEDFFSHSEDL